jgi:hypothetical protein
MMRRDAGIILWAAAGIYALVSAFSLVATYGTWIWTSQGSVMGGGDQRIYEVVFDLALVCLTLAAIAFLRQRAALSTWLFRETPRLPAAAAAAAEPGIGASERVAALDVCALAVAAVAIRMIVVCLSGVGRWAYLSLWAVMHPTGLLRSGTAAGLAPLIALVAAVVLIARRTSVAAWALQGPAAAPPANRLDVQRIGLRLFGLMLIFSYLPDLVTEAASAYDHAQHNPVSHGLPAGLRQPLLPPLLSVLLGVGLALGEDGLRSAWRRLRSQLPAEDQLEEDL